MKQKLLKSLPFAVATVYLFLILSITFSRHLNLTSFMLDLGNMHQRVWTTLHGVYMHTSYSLPILFDNQHFTIEYAFRPILLVFVPIYKLLPDPLVLVFAQAFAVAVASIPIYLLAKQKLQLVFVALVFQILFLFYPHMLHAVYYDFHPMTFAAPFLTWGFYFSEKKRYLPAIILLCMAMLCREIIALVVAMIGLYYVFQPKQRRYGLLLVTLGATYFLFVMTILYPHFSLDQGSTYIEGDSKDRYAWLGNSFGDMATNFMTQPKDILIHIFQPEKVNYLLLIFTPVYFINFLSPLSTAMIPILLTNLLSSRAQMSSGFYHYEAVIVPFLVMSTIFGIQRLYAFINKHHRINKMTFYRDFAFLLLFTLSLFLMFYRGPIALMRQTIGNIHVSQHSHYVQEFAHSIDESASVSTQNNLGPHFASRFNAYIFPFASNYSDYVIIDLTNPFDSNSLVFTCQGCTYPVTAEAFNQGILDVFGDKHYGVYSFKDNLLVFKKGQSRKMNKKALNDYRELLKQHDLQSLIKDVQ